MPGSGLNQPSSDIEPTVGIQFGIFRPAEVDILCGDSSKAERELGWERKYTFERLVDEMVKMDCN